MLNINSTHIYRKKNKEVKSRFLSEKKIRLTLQVVFSIIFNTFANAQCPPAMPLVAMDVTTYTAGGSTYIANGATYNCNAGPFYIWANQTLPINTYSDGTTNADTAIFTPCIKTNHNLYFTSARTLATQSAYEGGAYIGCAGPSGCFFPIGGTLPPASGASEWGLLWSYMDPTQTHDMVFSKAAGTWNNTTITVNDCWNGAILPTTIATPVLWSTQTSFTASLAANTNIGFCSFALTPVTGSALFDFKNGYCYVNPAVMPVGTYTVTYFFSGPLCPGGTTSQFVFTIANPYNAAWTAPLNLCSNGACVSLPPTVSGTTGGTWSGTGVGGTQFCPSTSGAGSWPVIYTVGISSTCKNTQTNNIIVNPLPTANAGATAVLTCTNASAVLSGSGGGSYSWTGPGIVSNGGTANPTINQPGTYNLIVTSSGCSSAVSSVNITQNIVSPVVTSNVSGILNCTLTSVNVNANTTSSPVSFSWSGTGITSGGTSSSAAVNQPGTFNYIVTNTSNGCTASGSQVVTQNISTPVVTSSASGVLNCTLTSVNVNASTSASPVTYNWSGSGITAGTGTGAITVNQSGTFNYTVTNTTNGCTTAGSQVVTQNTTVPGITMPATQTITCAAASVTLIASASPSNSNPVWAGGVTSGATSFTATASSAGDYTLTVTDPANGCVNSGITQVVPSAGFPVVTTSSSNSITCNTTTAQVVASTTTTPVSYGWTGPGITSGASTSTADVNASGQYTVVVQNTTSMCSSTVTVDVGLDNSAPVLSLSSTTNNGTISCTNTFVTISPTVTPSSNLTYTWMPGNVSSSTLSSATFTAAGVYTLAVTNTLTGCVTSLTNTANTFTIIADNVAPTFTLGTAPTVSTTCAAPDATLSGTSNADPNTIYTWITPIPSTVIGNPLISSTPGIYTVYVTNTLNGCSSNTAASQATVQVVPDSGVPVVALSTNSIAITCSNPTPSVSISTTTTPISYSWTPTAGIVAGTETTSTPLFNTAGTYSLIAENTTSGCATSISGNVVTVSLDNIAPSVSLTTTGNSGTITCANLDVSITPVISPSVNLTYTWSPATGISTPVNQLNATFIASGVYTLEVTNTLTGCVSTTTNSANTFTVITDTIKPTATIMVTSTNTIIGCLASNSTVTFSSNINSSNPTIINWLPVGIPTSTLNATSAGVYTLVVLDAVNGCSVAPQYTIDGGTTPPQNVDAGTLVSIPCGSLTTTLNGVTSSANGSYTWTGPSVTSINSGSNTANPIVNEIGDYTLTVTNTLTGCQSTATVNVSQGNVTALISADPTTGLSPLPVSFTCTSTGATNYSWNFGDGNTSASQNPVNIFVTSGSYTVILTASSGPCTSTASIVIVVEDGLTLVIPNVFTPNNDGSNDIFTIKSTGVKEISLQVFNRWGQKLYEFAGPKASWDGLTPQGGQVPEGTYFYFLKASGFDDTKIEKNGTVNLFR